MKRIVKVGMGQLDGLMTKQAARQWGDRNMPKDLKKAGFKTVVSESCRELHGGEWYRINYGYQTKSN